MRARLFDFSVSRERKIERADVNAKKFIGAITYESRCFVINNFHVKLHRTFFVFYFYYTRPGSMGKRGRSNKLRTL